MTTEHLLTLLTIATGATAMATFFVARKKDSKTEGAQEATFSADLRYIKELLQDVRSETRDIKKAQTAHSEHLAKIDAQMQALRDRIKRLEINVYGQKEE